MRQVSSLFCWVFTRKPSILSLIFLGSLVSLLAFFECFEPYSANATPSMAYDEDHDILPNAFEMLHGLNYLNPDSDGDGIYDGIEYVLRSDPLDPEDHPVLEPGMRVAAYEVDGAIKFCMIFFPGDIQLLETFIFYAAYGVNTGNTDYMLHELDLTAMMPWALSNISMLECNGFLISSYTLDIPNSIISKFAPISIGVGSTIAQHPTVDVLDFDMIDGQVVLRYTGKDLGWGDDEGYYGVLTNDPPQSWSDDEVCGC